MVPAQDVVRAASLMMAERPDLIVLGGDYVTWGDRPYVVPCSEALAGLRRRLASTRWSAITMTIAICRRR